MSIHPSGQQFTINCGSQSATIVEVGGGVREYTVGGAPVLQSYPVESMCHGAHGTPLIPWPNRLRDGRYTFDGVEHQVPLSEPLKNNAIHGFLRWRSWQATAVANDRVVMSIRLHPLKGYPFAVDYHLSDAGLSVSTTATNIGDTTAPYGAGQHPYLSPGEWLVDDCTLHLEAATRITTDDDRQLPTGREAVEGTPFDLRSGLHLRDLEIDHAYTDLVRDEDGLAWARLVRPDGSAAELWVDQGYPIIEIYTADTLAPGRRRRGLGTEPMTIPPNGLQSGEGIVRLEPGTAVTTRWGTRLR